MRFPYLFPQFHAMIETKARVKMKNVLFYGDSNTWGYQGDDPMHRLDADKRYTGVVAAQFPDVHFIEEGLCGRTICSTDPIDYGRNGMAMLLSLIHI